MIDDLSTRRSRRSRRSVTRPQALLCGGGGVCVKLLSGISSISRRCFTILSVGAPSRPVITQRGSGCWLDARESMPHLTGSTAGGWPAGFVTFVVFFPTPLGFPPPNVESSLLELTQSFLIFKHLKCTALEKRGTFYFPFFSKINVFFLFFIVFLGSRTVIILKTLLNYESLVLVICLVGCKRCDPPTAVIFVP